MSSTWKRVASRGRDWMTTSRSSSRTRSTQSTVSFPLAGGLAGEDVVVRVVERAGPQTGQGGWDGRRLQPDCRHRLGSHHLGHSPKSSIAGRR
jgi:hypothetical protein